MNYKSVYKLKHLLLIIYSQNIQELLIVIVYNKEKQKGDIEI